MTLTGLEEQIKSCRACPLHETRLNAVPGEGNDKAQVFVIGEAPGAKEDEAGEPFVGRSGSKLNEALESIGLDRTNVFISNLVKCRPPKNRNPKDSEIDICSNYLFSQISLVRPKVLLTLGKFSSNCLLGTNRSMSQIRGSIFHIHVDGAEVFVVPTYHPAATLYNKKLEPLFFEDFQTIKSLL